MHRLMEDNWIYREGRRNGHAYAASSRDPLDPARWPEFDHHVELKLGYAPHWRTGLPKPQELTRLQEFEDDLIARLSSYGELVATETTQAQRTVHLYLRAGCMLLEMFRDWATRDGGRKGPWVAVRHDPQWEGVAHLA
jgi:hypothetical protein